MSETTALDRALTFAYEHGQLPDSLMDAARAELATLRNQVERDALTGLLNRAGILDRLDTELKRAARSATHPAVLYVDLDHFKQLNDVHGHTTGDEALRAAAEAITSKLRATDHAGRLGGEELLVVLSDTEQPEVAAESIREAIHAAHALGVTASIGVASYRLHEPATELVARADQAMYAAKAAGRNRTRVAI